MNGRCDRRGFLAAAALIAGGRLLPRSSAPHPHAALFVHGRQPVPARHAAVVDAALRQRAAVHTSAWQRAADGERVLAPGPVDEQVFFWHGAERGKQVRRAWPFVAVLEYDRRGGPEAFVDWFRRAGDSRSDDGWLLDPGVGYADHINAEMVVRHDDRYAYMAVPDTPTDSHVGESEFVVRARVRWQDGSTARSGWWLRFRAPRGTRAAEWSIESTPLVDWRVTAGNRHLGATAIGPLADPERELAVWATDTVFRFPAIPAGLVPGRGGP